ncbi:hypothetical protein [Streptomyces sp. E5N91]|uniref:hypothetical protein n=1 Tax=Streptomyces sp. E5N91 TaxID=1851996 RepID=UPI001EE8B3E1|nr:hypothetical protein [Streptomyces sp. E5N91]
MKLYGRSHDRQSLARHAGDLSAAGGVRSVVLDDGSERGIRTLEFRTGGGLSAARPVRHRRSAAPR